MERIPKLKCRALVFEPPRHHFILGCIVVEWINWPLIERSLFLWVPTILGPTVQRKAQPAAVQSLGIEHFRLCALDKLSLSVLLIVSWWAAVSRRVAGNVVASLGVQ